MPKVPQSVIDNSVKVRQLSHHQFSRSAGAPGSRGSQAPSHCSSFLDPGAWAEVPTRDPDDAVNLQALLANTGLVHCDIERRVLMFGVTPAAS